MVTRLLILWLLAEQALHGYRIKKILEDEGLQIWFPIEYASIYSMLRSLVRQGYARIIAEECDGRRPRRSVFAITRKGRSHYEDLLRKAWAEPAGRADPFQMALAAQADVDESEWLELLTRRDEALEDQQEKLKKLKRAAPAPEMVELKQMQLAAERKWIQKQKSKWAQVN